MSKREAAIGISVLCALLFAALSASSASAFQTAVTCAPNVAAGAEQFSDAHCKSAATGNAGFKHVEIAEGAATNISFTNAKTASETTAAAEWHVTGTISGVAVSVTCTTVSGSGSLTNSRNAASEMLMSGTAVLTFSGCTVTTPSPCVIPGGSITTNTLAFTTDGQAANSIKFKPSTGTVLWSVTMSGCTNPVFNNTFPVTGSFILTASGATWSETHEGVTTQNLLRLAGNKAAIEGSLTVSMEGGNPISLT